MINGFETETQPLTDYELDIQRHVIRGLSVRVGFDNSIKASEMIAGLKRMGFKINDIRLRKIINNIRINGFINGLCATSQGYYVASNKTELTNYVESLKQRIQAQQAVLEKLIDYKNSL